jgi:2-pyrone-4,6-dicarboxylate lactonase
VNSTVQTARLPAGSTDAQLHIYGDPLRYPVRHENPLYEPPDATIEHARIMHAELGFERAVLVGATVYATDNSLIRDVLRTLPPDRYRGVAVIDDSVSDAQLEELHAAGVRGARFNFAKRLGLAPSLAEFRRSIARIAELGWFAKVFSVEDQLLELAAEFDAVRVPVVVDHMARLDFSRGVGQPAAQLLADRLKHGTWWVMLSNGDRSSGGDAPWDNAVPFGQLFFEAAPERCIWGSDWPHVHYPRAIPPDAELIGLLRRYVGDETGLKRVLVDNPARLFGFGA